jgi:hypothetical protein
MSSGLRNFMFGFMVWLVLVSGGMFWVASVTVFLGDPYATTIMAVGGSVCVLTVVELYWCPLYKAVGWIADRLMGVRA